MISYASCVDNRERYLTPSIRMGKPARLKWLLCLMSSIALAIAASESYGDSVSGRSYRAEVMPAKIKPGDPFVVRMTGMPEDLSPEASLNGNALPFGSCGEGCFIAVGAVEAETEPGVYAIDLRIGEKRLRRSLIVGRTRFPTVRLTLPEEKVSLSPEDARRAELEGERLRSLWEKRSDRLWEGPFLNPLKNEVSTRYGTKRIINGKTVSVHRGIDIRGKEGHEVKASNRGRVVLRDELFFGGNTIILDHGLGIYTVYMHLSGFSVEEGAVVFKGDRIGFVGSSGRSSGPHLHFGVKVQGVSANPLSFLSLPL